MADVYDFDDDNENEPPPPPLSTQCVILSSDSNYKCNVVPDQPIAIEKIFRTIKRTTPTVTIIQSSFLDTLCDKFIVASPRYKMTTELFNAYHKLIKPSSSASPLKRIKTIEPLTKQELTTFHTQDYISKVQNSPESILNEASYVDATEHSLLDYIRLVSSASVTAACALGTSKSNIAINWYGGWHHATKDGYSGFCFVNDCCYAINTLLSFYHKVLYIDLDIHHGDGVESAFLDHKNVLTFSAHKYSPGFFPTTGGDSNFPDLSSGRASPNKHEDLDGRYVNLPFEKNCSSRYWSEKIIEKFTEITAVAEFDAIVVVCGADCLKHDPLGDGFQVEIEDYLKVVREILNVKAPTLLLGGGGYNAANTARLWTCLSLLALGGEVEDLPSTIPTDDVIDFYDKYAPTYCLTKLD